MVTCRTRTFWLAFSLRTAHSFEFSRLLLFLFSSLVVIIFLRSLSPFSLFFFSPSVFFSLFSHFFFNFLNFFWSFFLLSLFRFSHGVFPFLVRALLVVITLGMRLVQGVSTV